MRDRRRLLTGAAIAVSAYLGYRAMPLFRSSNFEFESLSRPKGFRRIAGGKVSTAYAPFVGISSAETFDPLTDRADALVTSDICGALFGSQRDGGSAVRIASFSDYYCPYCRVQTKRLARIAGQSEGGVRVAWHELPLLGDGSRMAAKAALAAKRQGAYLAFHERMMRASFQATPDYLAAISDSIGLDYGRLETDMASTEVDLELHVSEALARRFGFVGTPGLVIGKTAVQGEIGERATLNLIEIERTEGLGNLCAVT